MCASEWSGGVNLTEWARSQGVHPQTAYRWFREGTLPVPVVRVNQRTVLVNPDAARVLAVLVCMRGCRATISVTIWIVR